MSEIYQVDSASFGLLTFSSDLIAGPGTDVDFRLASVTGSFTGSFTGTVSSSSFATTASFANNAISASYAPTSAGGTTLNTGSTYQITSSFAVTSSFALLAKTSSWAVNGVNQLTSGSNWPITSSWSWKNVNSIYSETSSTAISSLNATNSLSASMVDFGNTLQLRAKANGIELYKGTNLVFDTAFSVTHIPIVKIDNWTSSAIAVDDIGQLWAPGTTDTELGYLQGVTSAVQTQLNNKQGSIVTGSLIPITSSQAISASWAPSSGGSGTTLNTGSTYQITSSWALSARSASWAPGSTPGTTLNTGSTYYITSSVAVSASWAPGSSPGTVLNTGSLYLITSSWANNSVSASWAINVLTASTVKNTPINIKTFGAAGNGITDDTSIFNTALNTSNVVYVPSGSYLVSNLFLNTGSVLFGDGQDSKLIFHSASTGYCLNASNKATQIRNLSLYGGAELNYSSSITSSGNRHGISLWAEDNALVDNVKIVGFNGNGIYVTGDQQIYIRNKRGAITSNAIINCWAGIWMEEFNQSEYTRVEGNSINGTQVALRIGSANIDVVGNSAIDSYYGVWLGCVSNGRSHSNIVGNVINHTSHSFYINGAGTGGNICDNTILAASVVTITTSSNQILFANNYLESGYLYLSPATYSKFENNTYVTQPNGSVTNTLYLNNRLTTGRLLFNNRVFDDKVPRDGFFDTYQHGGVVSTPEATSFAAGLAVMSSTASNATAVTMRVYDARTTNGKPQSLQILSPDKGQDIALGFVGVLPHIGTSKPGLIISSSLGGIIVSGSNISGTSSYAVSASWAPGSAGSGTTLNTGSLYPITSSAAVSASHVPTASCVYGGNSTFGADAFISIGENPKNYINFSNTADGNTVIGVNLDWSSSFDAAHRRELVTPKNHASLGGSGIVLAGVLSAYKIGGLSNNEIGFFTTGTVGTSAGNLYTNTASVIIKNTGKVGIGLPNPVNKLDVFGNISCSVITASLLVGTSSNALNADLIKVVPTSSTLDYCIPIVDGTSGYRSVILGNGTEFTYNPGNHQLNINGSGIQCNNNTFVFTASNNNSASLAIVPFGNDAYIEAVTQNNAGNMRFAGISGNPLQGAFVYAGNIVYASNNTYDFGKSGSLTLSPRNIYAGTSVVAPSFVGTASWASNAVSASYAPGSSGGTTLNTGSTYPITASQAVSASWAPTGTGTLPVGSTQQITASWANNVSAGGIIGTVTSSLTASILNVTHRTESTAHNVLYRSSSTADGYSEVYFDNNGSLTFNPNVGLLSVTRVGASYLSASTAVLVGPSADTFASFYISGSPNTKIMEVEPNTGIECFEINSAGSTSISDARLTGSLSGSLSGSFNGIVQGLLTGSIPAYKEGLLFYDTQSYAFKYYNDNPIDAVVIGRETRVRVFNSSSNYISNSCPVYFSGSVNQGLPVASVYLAIADGTGLRSNVAGIATVDMPPLTYGYIALSGRVDNVTSTIPRFNFPVGPLYLSPTVSGSYQTTPPTGSFEKVFLGYCVFSSSVGSQMVVDINPHTFGAYTASVAITSSLAQTASNGAKVWGFVTYNGTTIVSNTSNCTVTRGTLGSWNVRFTPALNNSIYASIANGWSGSITTPTASLISCIKQTTTGFTMSVARASAATPVIADFNTASFYVFSF